MFCQTLQKVPISENGPTVCHDHFYEPFDMELYRAFILWRYFLSSAPEFRQKQQVYWTDLDPTGPNLYGIISVTWGKYKTLFYSIFYNLSFSRSSYSYSENQHYPFYNLFKSQCEILVLHPTPDVPIKTA